MLIYIDKTFCKCLKINHKLQEHVDDFKNSNTEYLLYVYSKHYVVTESYIKLTDLDNFLEI